MFQFAVFLNLCKKNRNLNFLKIVFKPNGEQIIKLVENLICISFLNVQLFLMLRYSFNALIFIYKKN